MTDTGQSLAARRIEDRILASIAPKVAIEAWGSVAKEKVSNAEAGRRSVCAELPKF